jgi:glycosyltransferase involved in cell wall biosynthesis
MILSIVCTAYNHEKYIRKTLEGFVKQKTDYKYKVIVHDDASTDKTRDIIDEFVKKYPNLFVTIYQKENQYSKGVDIYEKFIYHLINTKYIALCEGDDYWCDENKIQVQIDYLENHPNCSMCVHNTLLINEKGESLNKNINNMHQNFSFRTVDVILNKRFHTSSYMYRSIYLKHYDTTFKMKEVGDYPLAIFLSLYGYIFYIDKTMSCYRLFAENSWTDRMKKNKLESIANNNDAIEYLKRVNKITKFRYNEAFKHKIIDYKYSNIILEKTYWKIFTNKLLFIIFVKKCIPLFLKNIIKSYLLKK